MHLAYEALNGRSPTDPHSEDPAKAGFTELGRTAAQSSVLGNPAKGWSAGNPWELAPIHLMETLSPALARTGWAPGCMWTRPVVPRPAPASIRVYTYPGPGAPIYASEKAEDEWPFVPGDFVGLPMGSVTGPHIMVMPFGPAQAGTGPPRPTRILGARLTGPDGPVEVRTVDEATTGPRGDLGSYLDGGMVIPAEPLEPGADYRAHVSLLVAGEEAVDYSWTFRTAGAGVELSGDSGRRPRVRIGSVLRAGEEIRVTVLGAEAAGRRARISTQPLGRTCRPAGRAGPGAAGLPDRAGADGAGADGAAAAEPGDRAVAPQARAPDRGHDAGVHRHRGALRARAPGAGHPLAGPGRLSAAVADRRGAG